MTMAYKIMSTPPPLDVIGNYADAQTRRGTTYKLCSIMRRSLKVGEEGSPTLSVASRLISLPINMFKLDILLGHPSRQHPNVERTPTGFERCECLMASMQPLPLDVTARNISAGPTLLCMRTRHCGGECNHQVSGKRACRGRAHGQQPAGLYSAARAYKTFVFARHECLHTISYTKQQKKVHLLRQITKCSGSKYYYSDYR